jgi:hypothetical protein
VTLGRSIILPWLVVVSLANLAIADDESPPAPPQASAADLPASAEAWSPTPKVTPARRPVAKKAVQQAQHFVQQANSDEPLGFRDAYFQPSSSPGGARPAITQPQAGASDGSSVRQAQYVAQQPDAGAPLGFNGAHFQPSAPIDPSQDPGIFDEPVEEIHEPFDLGAPAPAVSSGDWIRTGRWYTEQSAVYMDRSTTVKNSVVLGTDFSSSSVPHYFNFLQIPLDMGFRPGLRSTVGRDLGRDDRNRDHALEFTFLGFATWHTSGSLVSVVPAGIFSNIDPSNSVVTFNASNAQMFAEASSLDSYELNYRIDSRPKRDQMVYTRDSTWVRQATTSTTQGMFAGLRLVTHNERLNYFGQSSIGNGVYSIFTNNSMIGPQIGFDWFYERSDWRLGMRSKAGGLVNFANQSSNLSILDVNGVPLPGNAITHDSASTLSFMGEMSLIGSYRIRPNFGIRVSYDVIFLTDQALVQNQLTFAPGGLTAISLQHALMFQGASLGFELSR